MLLATDLRVTHEPLSPSVWEVVRFLGSEVTLCHVVLRPTASPGNDSDGSPANPEETAIVQTLRASAVTALGDRGKGVSIKILHGDPGQRVCEYADYLRVDLIVLGPRAKASLSKSLRGSVSKYVVGNSRRHVLVLGG